MIILLLIIYGKLINSMIITSNKIRTLVRGTNRFECNVNMSRVTHCQSLTGYSGSQECARI